MRRVVMRYVHSIKHGKKKASKEGKKSNLFTTHNINDNISIKFDHPEQKMWEICTKSNICDFYCNLLYPIVIKRSQGVVGTCIEETGTDWYT